MTHEELQEQIPAYALDALSPEEAGSVEAHLATCADCQRELAGFREVVAALASGVAPAAPPIGLRGRVLAAAGITRGGIAAFPRPLLAVATVVVLLLTIATITLTQRVLVLQRQLTAQQHLLAVLAGSARTSVLTGSVQANVRFIYDPATGQGVLVVAAIPDPDPGRVYQLWLVAGTQPESAGVFRPAAGPPTLVPVVADFARFQVVAISVEPGPRGSTGPTTAPILAGNL